MSSVLIDGRPVRAPLSGVAQYVISVSAALAKRAEVEPTLLTFDNGIRANEALRGARLSDIGIRERRLRIPRKLFTGVMAYSPLPMHGLLGLSRYDIWHATYFESMRALPKRMSLVTTIYDVCFLRHPEYFTKQNLAGSQRALQQQLDESQAIITISEFTKRELVDLCGVEPERVLVTPLAPAIDRVAGAESSIQPRERPYMLYLGNLEPRKNLPRLLQAWRRSSAPRQYDLLLAGAPAYLSDETLREVEASKDYSVHRMGYISAGDKMGLLSGASAFLYPSLYEGFGIPALEALQAAVPVLTGRATAVEEVVGKVGVLVNPLSVDEIAGGIDNLVADAELRARLSAEGPSRALHFSWDKTAAATAAAYRQAVQS